MTAAEVISGRADWAVECGDCLALLSALPDGCVDAVLTDPPYGTYSEGDGYGRRGVWGGTQGIPNDDDLSALAASLPPLRRVLKPDAWLACFCSPKRRDDVSLLFRGHGLRVVGEVIWDKASPGLGGGIRYQHETVLLCSFGTPCGRCALPSVVREWVPKGQFGRRAQFHPHEKPLGLVGRLVRYVSDDGAVVLDPFAGSGTTGVACLRTGRRFIGFDVEPAYCDLARSRLGTTPPLWAHAGAAEPGLFDPPPAEVTP